MHTHTSKQIIEEILPTVAKLMGDEASPFELLWGAERQLTMIQPEDLNVAARVGRAFGHQWAHAWDAKRTASQLEIWANTLAQIDTDGDSVLFPVVRNGRIVETTKDEWDSDWFFEWEVSHSEARISFMQIADSESVRLANITLDNERIRVCFENALQWPTGRIQILTDVLADLCDVATPHNFAFTKWVHERFSEFMRSANDKFEVTSEILEELREAAFVHAK